MSDFFVRTIPLVFGTLFIFLFSVDLSGQANTSRTGEKDYKEPGAHDKFWKRRKMIAAWQINSLKSGALVVRLKSNALLLETLLKQGDSLTYKRKKLEQDAINLNIYRAFVNNYRFSKLYFIYSRSSDSLIAGQRTNCFLDSNLTIDPTIRMEETFYLIAEPDQVFNSSIGFVPEKEAAKAKENGTPVKFYPVVLKNKYGHQVKSPLPVYASGRGMLSGSSTHVVVRGKTYKFYTNALLAELKHSKNYATGLYLQREYIYFRYSIAVSNLDYYLWQCFRESPMPRLEDLDDEERQFLY